MMLVGAPPITAGAKRPPGGRGLSSEPKGSNASILQKFSKARKQALLKRYSPESFGSAHLTALKKVLLFSAPPLHQLWQKGVFPFHSTHSCSPQDIAPAQHHMGQTHHKCITTLLHPVTIFPSQKLNTTLFQPFIDNFRSSIHTFIICVVAIERGDQRITEVNIARLEKLILRRLDDTRKSSSYHV